MKMAPIQLTCANPECGRQFTILRCIWRAHIKYNSNARFFCSRSCANKGHSLLMSMANVSMRPDVAKRISLGKLGKRHSEEHRRNLSETRKRLFREGKLKPYIQPPLSVERRQKIREAMKAWWVDLKNDPDRLARQTEPYRAICRRRDLTNNPSKRPEVRAKASVNMKRRYKEHPELHPNHILSHSRQSLRKQTEQPVYNALLDMGYKYQEDFFHNYHVRTANDGYWCDFGFPKFKLDIECDGSFWHQDKVRDGARDQALLTIGWKTLRLDEHEIGSRVTLSKRLLEFLPMLGKVLA